MNKFIIEIKWSLIFVLMMLVWMLLERLAGLHDQHIAQHAIYTNFVAIPAILVYVLALLDKRKNFYHGEMTYKQGFLAGVLITLIVTILSPLMQYITTVVITPDYFTNMIEYNVESNILSLSEAESIFNMQNYIMQTALFTPVMGIVTTAIVAIFIRKRKK